MKQEKRIPTIIGIILLIAGIAAGVLLTKQNTSFFSKAGGDCTPINPQFTNITDTSFDVSFLTSASCLSSININGQNIPDIRFIDQSKTPTANKVHYFSINNLKEDSNYTFSFILNGTTFSKPEYKTRTAKKPGSPIPLSNLAWGRVYTSDLKPAVNSIVYLNIPGASPLSSFVTSSGNWNIPLATSFNQEKNNWFTSSLNTDEEIIVLTQDSPATQITSNTNRNNPVPDIIIGQNSFASLPATGTEGGISVSPGVVGKNLEIISPKEGETVNTKRPDIFGNSSSLISINFILEPGSINGSSTSAADGVWHWSPPKDLSAGDYIVTATAKNSKTGFVEKVSRKFKVSANSSGLAFTASSSAILITPTITSVPVLTTVPTQSPSKTPSLAPTKVPLPGPTVKPTSTPKPTLAPKATSTPRPTKTPIVRASKPSTSSGVPVTGSPIATIIFISLASIFVAVSFLF